MIISFFFCYLLEGKKVIVPGAKLRPNLANSVAKTTFKGTGSQDL
jgi:hypothetical protein